MHPLTLLSPLNWSNGSWLYYAAVEKPHWGIIQALRERMSKCWPPFCLWEGDSWTSILIPILPIHMFEDPFPAYGSNVEGSQANWNEGIASFPTILPLLTLIMWGVVNTWKVLVCCPWSTESYSGPGLGESFQPTLDRKPMYFTCKHCPLETTPHMARARKDGSLASQSVLLLKWRVRGLGFEGERPISLIQTPKCTLMEIAYPNKKCIP